MTVERRPSATELRVEGRKLSGTVMRYGEVSPSHRERFGLTHHVHILEMNGESYRLNQSQKRRKSPKPPA